MKKCKICKRAILYASKTAEKNDLKKYGFHVCNKHAYQLRGKIKCE